MSDRVIHLPPVLHRNYVSILRSMPTSIGVPMLCLLNRGLRLTRKHFLGTTSFGLSLSCNPRDLIQTMILHFGTWEPNITHVISGILQEGDVFVDVGANIGYHSLLGSKLVGSTGSVVAIEPVPDTFAMLLDNLHLNSCSNVRAVNVAVSDCPRKMPLYSLFGDFNCGAVTSVASRGGSLICNVEALPLDAILGKNEISRVKLIKIDIEGGELAVLHRLLETIDLYSLKLQLIVEMSASDSQTAARLFHAVQEAGFVAYKIDNLYTYEWYLKWNAPDKPTLIDRLPPAQTDLLFTRECH